jgi:hypothetical protein
MISPGRWPRDHARCEHLGAVDNAPEIDAEHPLPVLPRAEHGAAGLHSGVVHQNVGAAEAFANRGLQPRDLVKTADVGRHGHDVRRTLGPYRGHGQRGSRQPLFAEISDAQAQAQAREHFGRSKTDAGGTAGDDGHGIGR